MPVSDGKRLTGPESSLPYSVFSSGQEERGGRGESRGAGEHRKVFLSTGVISQAQGSAYVEQADVQAWLVLVEIIILLCHSYPIKTKLQELFLCFAVS